MFRSFYDRRTAMLRRVIALCAAMCAPACGAMFGLPASDAQAEPVTVVVKSGRQFTAEIDPRSDGAKLWLRFSKETSAILRPIDWGAVTEIRRGEKTLPIETVRAEAIAANAALPKPAKGATPPPGERVGVRRAVIVKENLPRGSVRAWPEAPGTDVTSVEELVRASAAEPVVPNAAATVREPVRSIGIDAYLANWDADVEADGLSLSVSALDGTGFGTAVDGTLEVELIGERQPPYSRGNAFPVLARWTKQVTAAEIEAAGGTYRTRLEFQALHPEYQLWLSNHALVNVRLLVPGDGAFEASVDGVPMRRFSPVRERAQQAFGTRFLPNEQTGRGHRESSTFGN